MSQKAKMSFVPTNLPQKPKHWRCVVKPRAFIIVATFSGSTAMPSAKNHMTLEASSKNCKNTFHLISTKFCRMAMIQTKPQML